MDEVRSPPGAGDGSGSGRPADGAGAEAAAAHPLVDALLCSLGGAAALLDDGGRVAALRGGFLEASGHADAAALLGLRLGDRLLPVAGAASPPAASAPAAAVAQAVEAAARGEGGARTCCLSARRDGVALDLDLEVRATPLELEGRRYTLVTLADVSGARRRANLERVLLHDLTNLISGLTGACGALDDPDPAEAEAASQDLRLLLTRLSREVQLQRALASGRPGAMRTALEQVPVVPFVERLRQLHQANRAWAGKALQVTLPQDGATLETDAGLLQRLVSQMLTNAFEATGDGGEVRLTVAATPDEVEFRTWNAGAIPPAVASRIFERYFSTRPGEGRGQGTYALRVLGEAYLKGQVSFTSTPEAGTTFVLRLPRSLAAGAPPRTPGS